MKTSWHLAWTVPIYCVRARDSDISLKNLFDNKKKVTKNFGNKMEEGLQNIFEATKKSLSITWEKDTG